MKIRVVPEAKSGGGLLRNWFGSKKEQTDEHPMSVNMAESLKEQLKKDSSFVNSVDDRGWTVLHEQALAGSAPIVRLLLDAGAAKTDKGRTALQLAQALGWNKVVAMLQK